MSAPINPAAVIDDDALAVRRTIRIHAAVEAVWATVTEPEQISRWFGRTELSGAEAGATGTITFDARPPIPIRIEAVDRPRSITYAWSNDDAAGRTDAELDPETATRFTFSLEPDGDATVLTVVEVGFERTSDPAANLASHAEGWTSELDKLVLLHERAS